MTEQEFKEMEELVHELRSQSWLPRAKKEVDKAVADGVPFSLMAELILTPCKLMSQAAVALERCLAKLKERP